MRRGVASDDEVIRAVPNADIMIVVMMDERSIIVQKWDKSKKEKREVGGKRYEACSRGRSSPDSSAFLACETPRR